LAGFGGRFPPEPCTDSTGFAGLFQPDSVDFFARPTQGMTCLYVFMVNEDLRVPEHLQDHTRRRALRAVALRTRVGGHGTAR
jgi:hypothetical protein